MRWSTALLWIAGGCGPSAESFPDDYLASYCAYAGDCHLYESVASCEAAYTDWQPDAACFDKTAARDCLRALDESACPTAEAPIEFPDACHAVYSCE